MTLAPFHSEGHRRDDTSSGPDPAEAGLSYDELWELEGSYAGPSADPTPEPNLRPRPGLRSHPDFARPDARTPRPRPSGPSRSRRARRRPAPVMRLGLLWALALGVTTGFAPPLAALLLVPVTAIAAQSAWRRAGPPVTEPWWLAPGAAAVCPLVALAGPLPAALAVVAAAITVAAVTGRGGPVHQQIKLGFCVAAPAAGSASLIAACTISPTIGLALLTAVCLFDASNHVVGTGETGGGLGALAGMASLAVLALLLAGLFVVPFEGASPWILCGMVAVAAPLSIGLAHGFVGRVRLPAWRRLDSLFLAGPLWVAGALILLPH